MTGQGEFYAATYALANSYPGSGLNAPLYDWDGALLAGEQWRVELYGGAAPDSLAPVINLLGGNREIVGLRRPGYFFSAAGFLYVSDVPGYGTAWLQVKVWDLRLAATYDEAVAQGLGGYGESALFRAQGGSTSDPLGLPAPLLGLTSFAVLKPVPEPSVIWLLLPAGLPVLWCRHWKRR